MQWEKFPYLVQNSAWELLLRLHLPGFETGFLARKNLRNLEAHPRYIKATNAVQEFKLYCGREFSLLAVFAILKKSDFAVYSSEVLFILYAVHVKGTEVFPCLHLLDFETLMWKPFTQFSRPFWPIPSFKKAAKYDRRIKDYIVE
ncbi:hypothetical protein CEXT_600241 [Caerostris extrusa]|uniref:Uncharacterized protein n=1 Tax=Caerostris extrusa TaxID=172846 RepID=A0AAV4QJE9_CAEEX|nr:hypothetical protein CEXT_600241 [Caerostris extrusa]